MLRLNVLKIPFLLILSTVLVPPAKRDMEMPGIEPGAFHMRSERATTALHPRLNNCSGNMINNYAEKTSSLKRVCIMILVQNSKGSRISTQ